MIYTDPFFWNSFFLDSLENLLIRAWVSKVFNAKTSKHAEDAAFVRIIMSIPIRTTGGGGGGGGGFWLNKG
jgi:hypothetical protein